MASSTAAYLYCVVKSARRPALVRAPHGLAEATRPQAWDVGRGLWLIAAEVPLDEYGPGRLEPRLQDLEWVARAAVAHEAVVEHYSRSATATVVPAKLFTMFSSIDKAIEDVASRRATINRVMKRIAGCEEWGVRVTRRAAVSALTSAVPARPTSGSAFLAARKAARDASADARAAAIVAAERTLAGLTRHARAATSRARRPEPGSNPPLLDAAFLVTAASRTRFKAEARRLAAACQAAGADLAITGPWPAYNFVGDPS